MRNILIALSLLLAIAIAGFNFFTGYRSAFEADQACHYEKSLFQRDDESLGCDHDIETDQWILFEKQDKALPARVIKRFKY